ncbi:MAG: hypothetical protein HFJ52_05195 [Clostridia bacterium]|jgi:hypothetical protein|nr:hypothetical protein [Clostridia bacterium]
MKNLTTYLFVIFMIMFWIFRIIVAFCYNLGIDFITEPTDLTFEIILLFLTFLSIILVIKRSTLGGIIYIIGNGLYFGTTIFNAITSETQMNYSDIIFSALGILLPILVLFDLLLDQNRKAHPVDKKTDWFYKNKDFDRQYDERADRNQYKF